MTVLSVSLADPNGSNAIVAAARWLQDAFLGSVATTLAVLAVATVGFLLLTGRLHIRRGATVLLGCFLLFGAPVIVAGLRGDDERTASTFIEPIPVPSVQPKPAPSAGRPPNYDPYAGAAVPTR